jgi:predicted AlkP superfamily phosphohydrolase/phosphomutase
MRTLIIGLDAFDPGVFERLSSQGRMPNLERYVEVGGYSRFKVPNPPQSEVSWTSIATGAGPGVHGIFDFVHRNPVSYAPHVSLLPTAQNVAGTGFVPPHNAHTLFEQAVRDGFPATVLWWPATFPARYESGVRTLPGLGTPDISGRLGVGTAFFADASAQEAAQRGERQAKSRVELLQAKGKDLYRGWLAGPRMKRPKGPPEIQAEFQLAMLGDNAARLTAAGVSVELAVGQWSPILEWSFKVNAWLSIRAISRVILTQGRPEPRLYFLPLQIHPLAPPWRYAAPPALAKQTWKACGPFLTVGWPQDTTGLEEGWISDQQFLALCESIDDSRERILAHHLQTFREGVFANVFDTLDRVQHMFWRDRPDIIEAWYVRLDALIGRIVQRLSAQASQLRVVIVSDHGFGPFDYKVHLNRWLIEQGYLTPAVSEYSGDRHPVDWERSRAYAIGLNSVYINLSGREGHGQVASHDKPALVNQLRSDMLQWTGPDGKPVVQQVYLAEEELSGPLAANGPDLLIGYAPGYRASSQTGLGLWGLTTTEANKDHWGADHCFDAQSVPGVLFCNHGLQDYPEPSFMDMPRLVIGSDLKHAGYVPPVTTNASEDQAIVEERLKSLGYL